MKARHNGEPGSDWHLADGPFHFSGPPEACRGELGLVNDSDHKLKVRLLETRAVARPRKGHHALAPTAISLSARLPAGSEGRVPAQLQLARDTAPGRYQGTVVCGKQTERLEVEVLARRELTVEPTHLRVRGHSGQAVEQVLVLTNRGNVPIDLRDVAMIWLEEVNWAGRTLVYSLRASQPDDDWQAFANRLLQDFRREMVAPARIQLQPPMTGALAPGQRLERTLRLTLPGGLRKGRRYQGFIKLGERRIWMELYCDAGETAQPSPTT